MKVTNNLYCYPEQGMFDCNTYVVAGSPGIIIDPGNPMFLSALVDGMRADGIDPKDIGTIVNTHLHGDHCAANDNFKELSGAKIGIHPVQKKNYKLVVIDGARLFGMPPPEFTEDFMLDGETLKAGEIELEMITAPGHSPDCVCFYYRQGRFLVCGDVVFDMNTGRVDLPGGNADELKTSIESLSELDIDYLLPGHMGIVTGKESVDRNFEFIKGNVLQWL
jgi:glyoxylase-like metal-dependent hydrolase (beta-lactamase superfamily II)